ncbi:hypothetical protein FSP39_004520 [Pinctada imbricata]|uniref:VWFA domain-containing protein n=1 Tax=Pinctada imbricata TaxID=66713 RepID=A0AA88Y905_PINIB|nr:hypothetical protein FSP39_004520 [Pinctada imbricata]
MTSICKIDCYAKQILCTKDDSKLHVINTIIRCCISRSKTKRRTDTIEEVKNKKGPNKFNQRKENHRKVKSTQEKLPQRKSTQGKRRLRRPTMNPFSSLFTVIFTLIVQQSWTAIVPMNDQAFEECKGNIADVVFILDSSASIYPPDFDKQISFVDSIVDRFNIGPNQIRVGVETFGETNWLKFHLNRYTDAKSLKRAIKAIRFRPGKWTNTSAALIYATETMFTQEKGERPDVTNIAVVITDGKSTKPKITKAAAEKARAAGIQIFAIGVGKNYDRKELEDIATKPSKDFVFTVDNYKALDSIIETFASRTCLLIRTTASPSLPTPSTHTTTVIKNATTTVITTERNFTFAHVDSDHEIKPSVVQGTHVNTTYRLQPTVVKTTHVDTTRRIQPEVIKTIHTDTTRRIQPTVVRTTQVDTRPSVSRTTYVDTIRRIQPPYIGSQRNNAQILDVCGGKPADIYFVMDSSRSIGLANYHKQKEFVKRLVGAFDLGYDKTRIGVVSYSNNYRLDIPLGSTGSVSQLRAAIDNVPYHARGTNTGDAIQFVRTVGFSDGMARRGVAQVMIVITDGLSRFPAKTAQEASLAHDAGIYTFAIGIGRGVDKGELSSIASNPDREFMFYVDGFDALNSIRDLLATRTCEKLPKDESAKPVATLPPQQYTDIVFVYDVYGIGARKASVIHQFILSVLDNLDLKSGYVQVGRLVEICPTIQLVNLGGLDSQTSMTSSFHYPGITDLIKQLESYGFSQGNGARFGAKKTAVIFLDENEHDIMRAVRQIEALDNMNVLTIIMGDEEKYRIPNTDNKQYVTIPDYNKLPDYKYNFQSDACFCGQN